MARDRNGPSIPFQFLAYPVTGRNCGTASYRDNATGYLLTQDGLTQDGLTQDGTRWFGGQYLSNDTDAASPYAAPAQASALSGLPPALVITAGFDPLGDARSVMKERPAPSCCGTLACPHKPLGMTG